MSGVPTSVEIDRYEWNFDGELTIESGPSQQHVFRAKNARTVVVRIVPKHGNTITRTAVVVVT